MFNWEKDDKQFFSKAVSYTGEPALGVAGYPFVPALVEDPILSIHVKQFKLFPPIINPVF